DTVTYSDFSNELPVYLDQVNVDRTPLLVTRQDHAPVVVMSLDDFKAYEETFYLLSSQKNAERLNEAIADLRKGKGIERELIDE
ncbi:MAG: type II toxin-antitoxin system prevent-host-death family antitoxin, partial [Moorea sp. SIO3C2]|nr:type II toxin-antitoxin system prevent-host-death family antitoxin [Moorena sp. SIO3C2]